VHHKRRVLPRPAGHPRQCRHSRIGGDKHRGPVPF
jgi:hypothetical protein